LSVDLFHASVIESSVADTKRRPVGTVGGVVSRRGPACAAGAISANASSVAQQPITSFIGASPP
jgi:hypothetical protein